MIELDHLVTIGKQTMEMMRAAEGSGVFEPTLLAEYADGECEVTLIAGGMDHEALTEGLIHIQRKGPLASIGLTADASLRGQDKDALIILLVSMDGARTAMAPYILERTAHKAMLVWDDTVYTDSDPRYVAALQTAIDASRATMEG